MTSCGRRHLLEGINLLTERGMERAVSPNAASFDPWMALMARRPLGDVMRARKVTTSRTATREKRDEQRHS